MIFLHIHTKNLDDTGVIERKTFEERKRYDYSVRLKERERELKTNRKSQHSFRTFTMLRVLYYTHTNAHRISLEDLKKRERDNHQDQFVYVFEKQRKTEEETKTTDN